MTNHFKDLLASFSSPLSSPARDSHHTHEASHDGDTLIDLTTESSSSMAPDSRERQLSRSTYDPHAHVSLDARRPHEQAMHRSEDVENIIRQYQEALDKACKEKHQMIQQLEVEKANLSMRSESEKTQLRKEILAHKARIVKLTETHSYKTDQAINAAWERLYSDVQGWACQAFRTLKPEFSQPVDKLWLEQFMPLWRLDRSPTYRLNILLATVASGIEYAFHNGWKFGATRDSPLADLADRATKLSESPNIQDYKKWLALTRSLLQDTSNEQLKEAKTNTARQMLLVTQEFLREVGGVDLTRDLAAELVKIFNSALDIMNCLQSHPATFVVEMLPARPTGHKYIRNWSCDLMQDINGKNDDELPKSYCGGSVFPGIRKIRDEDDQLIEPVSIFKMKLMAVSREELMQLQSNTARRS